uniref:BTB domain-containing protein n=1 Tax=Clytia hemisphaerica TaxID=252671 RepID=A0A7M5WRJ8_9CNID
MASINGDNIVPNEERNEKLVPFDFHENECDVIIKTKDKEVQLPSSFLEMVSSPMYFNNNVKYVFDVDVCAESVTKALSFYHPKDWTNKIDCSELDDLLLVTNTLKLKSFKLHLIDYMKTEYVSKSKQFDENYLQVFHAAQKYELTTLTL